MFSSVFCFSQKPLVQNLCKYSHRVAFRAIGPGVFCVEPSWVNDVKTMEQARRNSGGKSFPCFVRVIFARHRSYLLCFTLLEFRFIESIKSLNGIRKRGKKGKKNSVDTLSHCLPMQSDSSFVCTHSLEVKKIHLLNCMDISKSF